MYLCLCKKNIQIFLNEDMYIQICSNHYPRGVQMCTMGVGVRVNFHKGLYIPKNLLKINLLK